MNARLNNFDLIRLLAALQVVFVHAVGHTQLLETGPGWLLALLDGVILFPGVAVFFVISGFLIAGSWERSRDRPLAYFWRRGLRIYPALLVCVGVSVVILGIFGFLRPEVVGSVEFWAWLGGQLTFGQFYNPEFFREFGVGTVNGALWTISVELQFYAMVPLVYLLAFPRDGGRPWRRGILPLSFLLSFAAFCFVDHRINGPEGFSGAGLVPKLMFVSAVPHWWMFVLGIWLHRHFDRVKGWLEGKVWIHLTAYAGFAALRTYGVGREGPMAWLFYAGYLPERVLLALLTVSAAYSHRGLSSRLLNGADISYGVYIYHFLLINLLIELGGMGSPGWVVLVFVLAIAAGLVSWFGIERRALSLKSLVPGRASPVASPIDRPARDW